jgi:wyosine [tRNA(Phe)-imidazoG37] synthetase (radical SAM superfamily)
MKYDRFNLEEEIQNVWQTKDDLDAIAERHYDDPDGPMSADELSNVLIGLSELHETRMKKLWRVFETMIKEKQLPDDLTTEAIRLRKEQENND